MEEDAQADIQKCMSDDPMDTDEGPLINENSNGLSHLLTEGEFNSVDAVGVDESSASNQGFLNAVELSAGSVGDYLENNTDTFNAESFDVGDNAVNFPSDSLNNVLSDGDSHLSDTDFKAAYTNVQTVNEQEKVCENEVSNELSNLYSEKQSEDTDTLNELVNDDVQTLEQNEEQSVDEINAGQNTLNELVNDDVQTLEQNEEQSVDEINAGQNTLNELVNDVQTLEQNEEQSVDEINAGQSESNASLTNTIIEENNEQIKSDNEQKLDISDFTLNSEIGDAGETEVVSEDELPEVEKPSIKDAENVSDDELPGPKPAELPADTEVVSEDELPSSKKDTKTSRKRKPEEDKDEEDLGSPSAESESSNKKQAVVKNGESKPIPSEKRLSTEEKPKKKVLPELDKYWKVVNDDPTDFTGWTYLLQYVDQETDVEAAREAYDAFLSHYPYCYGYWRKYADYEKKKGSKKKCLDVLERGLKAIPLSVDLWIHYLNHVKTTRPDDHCYIRSQYERAVEACGLEFRSDRLWESYIKWEADNGTPLNVTKIYDRLLATPTLGYTSHFDNFQEHVMSSGVKNVVSSEELVRLRGEVRAAGGPAPQLDLPPGEDEPPDHVASDEEAQAIKERIISARRKVHKTTGEEVASRWTFEEGIKRPYFHVKPLERCQLKNWKSYLEWEKQHGSFKRALVLHERCLIACALYEEFWMRLIKFLGERSESDPSLVPLEREVLERACAVHHLDKPDLHLHWAHFEEQHGQLARAADILERIEKACPNVVQIHYRRINLERRRGDYEKCVQLYEAYISGAKSKAVASALSVKYARFLFHVRADPAGARRVLDDALARDPLNARLHLQRLDLALHTPDTPYEQLDELIQSYSKTEGAELEVSAAMASRRRELAEELGDAAHARAATLQQRALARQLARKRARKDKHEPPPAPNPTSSETKKKESSSAPSSAPTGSAPYYPAAATGPGYEQSYPPQSYPSAGAWGYQQPPPYQHNWPQYPNYY